MKRISMLLILLMVSSGIFAQKKEKLKGSRNVTSEQKEIGNFENLEIEDNIEVFLTSGDKTELEIEADDNLHDAISINIADGTLRLSTTQEITGAKKLSVKITYTDDFKMVIAKDNSRVTSLTDMKLDNFTFKTFGSSKIYSTIKTKVFTLMANDKSHVELNLNAENAMIELSKNAQLKALISSPKLKFDMYEKAIATVEGDVSDLKLRLDNNTNFTGKNLTAKTADMVMEGNSNGSLTVVTSVAIEASGKSETELIGEQKITIRKFTDNASIRKKPLKT
jgi:hypothetical protein